MKLPPTLDQWRSAVTAGPDGVFTVVWQDAVRNRGQQLISPSVEIRKEIFRPGSLEQIVGNQLDLSLIGELRDELLDGEIFDILKEA